MKVAVVDYGMGNLHSVLKSVQAAQSLSGKTAEIYLTDRPEDVSAADKIIFPGQGAMPDCMAALRKSGLGEAVADGLENKPFFGICVGAQLLFEHSEEGDTAGLGRFKGRVKRFLPNQTDAQGNRLKVPHMGWNTVCQTRPHPLFKDIAPNSRFYFVHSYYFARRFGHQRIPARIRLHRRQRQRIRHPVPHGKKPRCRPVAVTQFFGLERRLTADAATALPARGFNRRPHAV